MAIDHEYQREITCPYCGYKFRDSWEFNDDTSEQTVECHACEKEFLLYVEVSVDYTTKKKEGVTTKEEDDAANPSCDEQQKQFDDKYPLGEPCWNSGSVNG
jgi:DNA-directed RNA polymerase subunit RPC12/RpoP